MTALHIDLETRSTVDLRDTGVYVYAEDPGTDVWCAAYAVDDGPVKLWTPGQPVPAEVQAMCADKEATVVAHNANFERGLWHHVLAPRYGWPVPRIEQWRCTMAMALAMALPGSLENCAAALGLEVRKDAHGYNTMLRMCRPRRSRKGEDPKGVYWFDDEDRKQELYAYCAQDVEVERLIDKRLLALRPSEQTIWELDQIINDRGVFVDLSLCHGALKVVEQATRWLNDELYELTGGAVSTVTNVGQIAKWLREEGYRMPSLDKAHLADELLRDDLPPHIRRVLEIRQEGGRGANAKIGALLAGRSKDGRSRGLLQYHQASTGRWAGRRFQPQNLPRGSGTDPEDIVDVLRRGDAELVRLFHDDALRAVSDCLRSLVCAPRGKRLIGADFSNIEGRLIAWLAGEAWKVQAFYDFDDGTGHDIYKLSYAAAFGVRPEDVDKNQRQIGKVMELALGYQGGVGAFQKMAVGYGVQTTDARANELKQLWRNAHPSVVRFWYALEEAAMAAVEDRGKVYDCGRIRFRRSGSWLFMRLPNGRSICYPYPEIAEKEMPWGDKRPQLRYRGVDSYTRKWGECWAHGGLLFNNAVQGTARDIEAEAIVRAEAQGYPIILSVHDELVAEVEKDFGSMSEFENIMVSSPPWAPGLPIAAQAWEGPRYKK